MPISKTKKKTMRKIVLGRFRCPKCKKVMYGITDRCILGCGYKGKLNRVYEENE